MFGIGTGSGGTRGTGPGGKPAEDEQARNALATQLMQIEWLAYRFFIGVLCFIGVYSLAEWWRLDRTTDVLLFDLSVLCGLTVTAAVVGGLLGFLFGIPRTLQGNNVASNSAPASAPAPAVGGAPSGEAAKPRPLGATGRAFAGNSNLEEISDWLTKIIVGVSLVQANSIFAKIMELAGQFKAANPDSQGADVMFVLVLVSSLIGGFLFLYLETRTRVMSLFTEAEAALIPRAALADPAIQTALQAPIGTGRGQQTAPTSPDDEKLLKIPYEALQTGDQLAAWASAQARAGNLQAANQALRAAIAKEPGNKDYLVRLADVLDRQGSTDAAKALIAEAQQKQGNDLSLLKRDLLQALYVDPPQGFQKALQIAQQLLVRPDGANDPYVHLWTAAAEGQNYTWLSASGDKEAEKQASRARALAEAKKVVELAPDPKSPPRSMLRGLLDPSSPDAVAGDDDLNIFKDDDEFKKVING